MLAKNYHKSSYDYIIKYGSYQIQSNYIIFKTMTAEGNKILVRLDIISDNIIRTHATINETVIDNNTFLEKSTFENEYKIEENNNYIYIKTRKLNVKVEKEPWNITYYDLQGSEILTEKCDDVNAVGKQRVRPLGITTDKDGNILGFNEAFKLAYNEHFYGLGEKFTDFDKRSSKVTMWNRDTLGVRDEISYKNIPFFISTTGYGIFVNSSKAVEFNMGSTSTASYSINVPAENIDYFFIYGPDYKKVLSRYTDLTGKAPLPPLWSFGLWLSTGFKEANRESVEDFAKQVREKEIPTDLIHFDCYWLRDDMWCDLVWDEDKFNNPGEMINHLKRQGYKICLWINPYVSIKSEMYLEGREAGYFLKKEDGTVYIKDLWHGLEPACGIVDFTNPQAVKWFQVKLKKLLDMGVDVFKTDFGEEIPEDSYFYNGKTGTEMHNLYSLLYNKIVYSITKEVKGKETMVWGRSGYAGSQKYPVCWSGDPACSFEAMASVLRSGLSYGMSGISFWSHDIGGFYGTPSKELYIRWAQFGLFSSHSRCHGTTAREPWKFGSEAEEIVKKYTKLRYKLLPYIYSTAVKSTKTGAPFIRPLLLEHQDDPTTYFIDDQYYFGDSILVAPLFSSENRRKIYLPAGEWFDYWTNKVYEGGCWIEYQASLDILPLFVKKGAIIPVLTEEINYIDKDISDYKMQLDVYGKEDSSSIIYINESEKINVNISNQEAVIHSEKDWDWNINFIF